MKLAISNIAWSKEYDEEMYEFLSKNGIEGLEIAPTRIFEKNPYTHVSEIKDYAQKLKEKYNLTICSMQSIWYGKTQNIFLMDNDDLLLYTKKCIDFASAIECRNLVFGCPKNRNIPEGHDHSEVFGFFRQIGNYAYEKNTFFSLEPNPTIYNTNFMNHTNDAIKEVELLNNPGIKVNFDLGTVIYNKENVMNYDSKYINHIHISEPFLKPIELKKIHGILKEWIIKNKYDNYVSIEMGNCNDIEMVKRTILKVKELFNDLL